MMYLHRKPEAVDAFTKTEKVVSIVTEKSRLFLYEVYFTVIKRKLAGNRSHRYRNWMFKNFKVLFIFSIQ